MLEPRGLARDPFSQKEIPLSRHLTSWLWYGSRLGIETAADFPLGLGLALIFGLPVYPLLIHVNGFQDPEPDRVI